MTTLAVGTTGTQVSFQAEGHGPGLILLHGTSLDSATNFGHLTHHFTDRRRVITPDYAGSGESTLPESGLTLDLAVAQIVAVIDHTSDGPVDLVGESLGAVVAAATAARHPEKVRRLGLVAGWADSSDVRHQLVFGTWKQLQQLDGELANRYIMSLALSPRFLSELGTERLRDLARQPAPSETLQRIDLGLRVDLRAELRQIQAPTLIVKGDGDQVIPGYQTEALARGIADSTSVTLACGHAVSAERPDELCALLRDLLFS